MGRVALRSEWLFFTILNDHKRNLKSHYLKLFFKNNVLWSHFFLWRCKFLVMNVIFFSDTLFVQNRDLSMIIIVPEAVDGLSALVEGLSNYRIGDIRKQGKSHQIDVFLPKFKIESTLSLREPLEEVIYSHWLLKFLATFIFSTPFLTINDL